jgi:hypothetical protein
MQFGGDDLVILSIFWFVADDASRAVESAVRQWSRFDLIVTMQDKWPQPNCELLPRKIH